MLGNTQSRGPATPPSKPAMQVQGCDVLLKKTHGSITIVLIASAGEATLNLDNQKNGWKGGCVYHETNGDTEHWVNATSISYITEPPRRLFFWLFTTTQANAAISPTRT
jgi:hypothetical protein